MKSLDQQRTRFVLPAVLFVILLAGLLSGLLGDGLYDDISWVALAVPLGMLLFYLAHAAIRGKRQDV